jgi:hypothetical protein
MLSGLVITQLGSTNSADFITTDADMPFSFSSADASDNNEENQTGLAKTESLADDSTLNGDDPAQTLATNDGNDSVMNGQIIEVQSIEELKELSASWPIEDLARESAQETSVTACVTDPAQRLITRRARLRGTLVEIYQTATGSLTVYAQGDCTLIARLGS